MLIKFDIIIIDKKRNKKQDGIWLKLWRISQINQ